ncbi:MAG: hypothetical protein RLP15_13985 [Cryomorphaceae bacterium]
MFTQGLIAYCIVSMGTTQLSAQTNCAYRQPANERVIPQAVLDMYREQYPNALVRGWHSQLRVAANRLERPTYIEIEFSKGNVVRTKQLNDCRTQQFDGVKILWTF